MSTWSAVIVAIVAVLTILGAAARQLERRATQTQTLVSAMAENTKATEKLSGKTETLSGKLDTFSSETIRTLAEHETRITHLEGAP